MASVSPLNLFHLYSGKVRDLYEVDGDHLLMVASDRLSAYDVVMEEPIKNKGRVLTGLTNYWMNAFPRTLERLSLAVTPPLLRRTFRDSLAKSGSTVERCSYVKQKCSLSSASCALASPARLSTSTSRTARCTTWRHRGELQLTDAFPEPIFTPSTKAEEGHDENIDLTRAASLVGQERLDAAAALCLELFSVAAAHLATRGLILADTKFELGVVDGELVVCDEVFTPDSSRIWPAEHVRSGEKHRRRSTSNPFATG